jgi:hypothetical protein
MTITAEELAKLRMAATPGVWDIQLDTDFFHITSGLDCQEIVALQAEQNDAALIVATVNALRSRHLVHVDEVEKLRAALREVHRDCLQRAKMSRDGRTVPIGDLCWTKVCAALGDSHE